MIGRAFNGIWFIHARQFAYPLTRLAQFAKGAHTLVHGDCGARHLLLTSAGELGGVIDWGDLHLGDAATDLALVHSFLPRTQHARFLAYYGPVDPLRWAAARFRALFVDLAVLLWAHDVGERATGAEARRAIEALIAP